MDQGDDRERSSRQRHLAILLRDHYEYLHQERSCQSSRYEM